MNILAVGAHPDDIELGCFGTLAKHYSNGDKIFGAIITNGELSSNPKIRYKETKEAANLLRMKLFFGDFPDGNLRADSALVSFLDKIIKTNKVTVMYTHSRHDRHQDHRVVAEASISAARYLKELYSYETPTVIFPFNPQLFVDVTNTFKIKTKAIKKHSSQLKKKYMRVSAVEGLAKFRAYQVGNQEGLCEGFEIHKILKDDFGTGINRR